MARWSEVHSTQTFVPKVAHVNSYEAMMFFISYENDLWSSTILVPSPATYSEADTVAEGGEIMEERERERNISMRGKRVQKSPTGDHTVGSIWENHKEQFWMDRQERTLEN